MTPFLKLTARDLYQQFGEDLPSVAVVFPNNRARLFFSEHLWQEAGKPVWTPAFTTISELFRSLSEYRLADPLELNTRLYRVFRSLSEKEESFDLFEPWGEVLLSDFDDADKNMADVERLFRNIRDWGEQTDTLEHLTEEQVASIRLFFKNFDPDRKTELKERFIENWNLLLPVYEAFRKELAEEGLAYEGMMYRQVVEKHQSVGVPDLPYQHYAFVGFNVLNACETQWFSLLQKAGKALFYWDRDQFYLRNPLHEAGRFLQQNLQRFPGQLKDHAFDDFERTPKTIRFLSAPTENAQARYLPEWIAELQSNPDSGFHPEETAVVLCNENLLLPVLHCVPDEVPELNVTMGFPLQQTPVYSLVNQIAALHADGFLPGTTPRFNHRYVLPVLQHPLVRQESAKAPEVEAELRSKNSFRPSATELQAGDSLLTILFTPRTTPAEIGQCLLDVLRMLGRKQVPLPSEENEELPGEDQQRFTDAYDPLLAEALYRCHSLVGRLQDLMERGLLEAGIPVYRKLLQQLLSRATIPFSGEPVRGMQIMGLLETRNLDFKNVLLLSVNEGMLPKGVQETSFIPWNLRKAYGLTTPDHKDSVFAYYFFRLLQRAEHISLVYNTASEGLNRGEMSRFMLQLLVESPHAVSHHNLRSDVALSSPRTIRIEKTNDVLDAMRGRITKLSPTALNLYLDCSLRFYFRYVAGMREPDEVSDEVDGALLGNLFHHSAQFIYTSILLQKAGKPHDTASVDQIIKEESLNSDLEAGRIRGIIDAEDLKPWIAGARSIEQVVDHYFRRDFFQCSDKDEPAYTGEHLIKCKLVAGFLTTLLKLDRERAPFRLLGLEKEVLATFKTSDGHVLKLGGIIDRLDQKENRIRVLDYKTGGQMKDSKSFAALFEPAAERPGHVFQTLIYCTALSEQHPEQIIHPEICYIHQAGKARFTTEIKVAKEPLTDFKAWADPFREGLKACINGLFDASAPFIQTPYVNKCAYCEFKNLCRR